MSIEIVELSGSPEQMGLQHASACREAGLAMVRARCELALATGREHDPELTMERCLDLAWAHLPLQALYSPRVHAEFGGLADGLDVGEDELLIGNGYTDYVDVLAAMLAGPTECTSFIATGEATGDGLTYVGQTWDMNAFAEPHLRVFRRRPDRGPGWVTLTTGGCLSLIGLSEAGIAVGNTNLSPTDARPGVMYLAMIHEALRSEDSAQALAAIADAPRASGHYYYLADAQGEAAGIETTAARHVALDPPGGLLVHANHYHDPGLGELARQPASENSLVREKLLDDFLRPKLGALTLDDLIAGMRLTQGPHPVCRPPVADPDDYTTCAAAIICPQRRSIWIAPANPAQVEFEEVHA